MQKALQKIFSYWGSDLITKNGTQETAFRGFLQHSSSKSWQNMEKIFSTLGEIPRGQYTLIALPDVNLAVGDTVVLGERSFEIRRLEEAQYRNEPLYTWGLCVEKGGEDTWAMQL